MTPTYPEIRLFLDRCMEQAFRDHQADAVNDWTGDSLWQKHGTGGFGGSAPTLGANVYTHMRRLLNVGIPR